MATIVVKVVRAHSGDRLQVTKEICISFSCCEAGLGSLEETGDMEQDGGCHIPYQSL